ncbi:MAG: toxin-antitoxin system YwqK family antitoxin [Flavobacteriales bacterium]
MIYKGDTVNRFDANGKKHGKWVRTFPESKDIRLIAHFQHGSPRDTFRYYYRDGTLKAINVFGPKGIDSHVKTFHPNGKRMARGKYINKKKDSLWIFYDPEGVKSAIQEYRAGLRHGKELVFYRNGDTALIRHYKDSLKHGPWKKFFKKGGIQAEGRFKEGRRAGKLKYYHPNGALKYEGEHNEKGFREGKWIWYKKNGKLDQTVIYDNGEIDSIIGPDGKLISNGPPIDSNQVNLQPKKKQEGPRLKRKDGRFERKRGKGKGRRGP